MVIKECCGIDWFYSFTFCAVISGDSTYFSLFANFFLQLFIVLNIHYSIYDVVTFVVNIETVELWTVSNRNHFDFVPAFAIDSTPDIYVSIFELTVNRFSEVEEIQISCWPPSKVFDYVQEYRIVVLAFKQVFESTICYLL